MRVYTLGLVLVLKFSGIHPFCDSRKVLNTITWQCAQIFETIYEYNEDMRYIFENTQKSKLNC